MKKLIFLIIICAGILALVNASSATVITFDYNFEFSEATAPSGPTPWIRATFDDGGTAGTVTLTFDDVNLVGSEKVTEWDFNLDPSLDPTSLSISYSSGVAANWVSTGTNAYKADGDGYYDIEFMFPNSGTLFTVGSTSVYSISMTGITADSFNFLSFPSGGHGPYYSAAHVQSIGDAADFSGWVAPIGTLVPEPTTLLLFGMGLLGVAAFRRKSKE